MSDLISVTVSDGKYTIQQIEPGRWECLRYGEPWPAYPNGPGNLEVALAYEIDELRNQLNEKRRDRVGDSEIAGGYLCRAEKAEAAIASAAIPQDILDRYDTMLAAITSDVRCEPEPGTQPWHLRWMLQQIPTFTDVGKANRWLAFVQAMLIFKGQTTVTAERDFTRPYFSTPLTGS